MRVTSTTTSATTPVTRRAVRLRGPSRSPSRRRRDSSGTRPAAVTDSRARRLDDVAGAADRVDQFRLDRVDLLAQVADVELDDVRLALEVVLPHPVEDLRLGEHHPLVAHQVAQQLELGGGQM